jgi:hypothetical protein
MKPGDGAEAVQACGHALERRFGFPDRSCGGHSPMEEYAQRIGQALPTASEQASAHGSGSSAGRRR